MPKKVWVGTSGYSYSHWADGVFYPQGVLQREWLEYYAKHFNTVELNVTFYRLPKKEAFKSWYTRTADDFVFAVKGSRYITHVKKLNETSEAVGLFFERASALKKKLGIVLWQLPPNLKVNLERLEKFCKTLALNKEALKTRHAFEFREKSWFCDEVYSLLKRHNYSLCIAHSNRWPFEEVITASYVYLRFHGGEMLYGSNYSKEELKSWVLKAKKWLREKRDVYAYFNNDAYGYAVCNAIDFKKLMVS